MDGVELLEGIADRIRTRARKKGLSIERLADHAGISRSMMWDVLACKHSPNVTWLLKVAETLECKVRDLIP